VLLKLRQQKTSETKIRLKICIPVAPILQTLHRENHPPVLLNLDRQETPALPTTAMIPFGFKVTGEARGVQNDLERGKTDLVICLQLAAKLKLIFVQLEVNPWDTNEKTSHLLGNTAHCPQQERVWELTSCVSSYVTTPLALHRVVCTF